MKRYIARYTLRNGAKGSIDVIASHSCDVVNALSEQFWGRLRYLSVRAA